MERHPFQDCSQTVDLIHQCGAMCNLSAGSSKTSWYSTAGIPEFNFPSGTWGSRKNVKKDFQENALSLMCAGHSSLTPSNPPSSPPILSNFMNGSWWCQGNFLFIKECSWPTPLSAKSWTTDKKWARRCTTPEGTMPTVFYGNEAPFSWAVGPYWEIWTTWVGPRWMISSISLWEWSRKGL